VSRGSISDKAAASNPLSINQSCARSAESQIAIDRCARKIEKEAQSVLNAALVKERTAIDPALVNAAESKWIAYRDTECTAYASINRGGTIYPTVFSSCEYELTVKRVDDVRKATSYAET
jgi:uncharacterized protein YecT (DUF1311 family)